MIVDKYKDKEAQRKFAELSLKFVMIHKAIIEEHGRYPHRNEVLGRESTLAELEYLKTAQRFGQ